MKKSNRALVALVREVIAKDCKDLRWIMNPIPVNEGRVKLTCGISVIEAEALLKYIEELELLVKG